jgi:hypothetical protein
MQLTLIGPQLLISEGPPPDAWVNTSLLAGAVSPTTNAPVVKAFCDVAAAVGWVTTAFVHLESNAAPLGSGVSDDTVLASSLAALSSPPTPEARTLLTAWWQAGEMARDGVLVGTVSSGPANPTAHLYGVSTTAPGWTVLLRNAGFSITSVALELDAALHEQVKTDVENKIRALHGGIRTARL